MRDPDLTRLRERYRRLLWAFAGGLIVAQALAWAADAYLRAVL